MKRLLLAAAFVGGIQLISAGAYAATGVDLLRQSPKLVSSLAERTNRSFAQDCPCKTSRGQCRREASGRPAVNCHH